MRPVVLFHRRADSDGWVFFLEVASLLDASGADLEYWILGGMSSPLLEVAEALDLLRHLRVFGEVDVDRVHREVASSGGLLVVGDAPASLAASALSAGCPVVMERDPELALSRAKALLEQRIFG